MENENIHSLLFILLIIFSAIVIFVFSKDWKRLEDMYQTTEPAPGNLKKYEFGSIGIAHYRGSLCVGFTNAGLYLSIVSLFNFGLKPLLIPWNKIQKIESTDLPFFNRVRLTLSSPSIKIIFKKDLLNSAKQHLPANDIDWNS